MHRLTLPQQSIYVDALLHGATTKHNMGGAIVIHGPLDEERFQQALACAMGVHDVQRMRLHRDGETAVQEFLPETECRWPFQTLDFSDRPEALQAANEWVLADIARPMRVDQFPLHGDVLFRLGDHLHLWYPKFHHIAYDAFGHSLIAGTVAEAYNQLLRTGSLPSFERRSYVDFIEDDRAYAASSQFRKDCGYWRDKFAAMPQPLPFTARKGELTGNVLLTERQVLAIRRPTYSAAVQRAEEAGVTPFHLLLACLYAYLARISGCDDIVFGTPILNRGNHAFRRTAGMFMNMMPLRIQVDKRGSILSLAAQIKAETRACYRHQRFPLAETLRHCRSLDGFCHGVFDVTVTYRKLDYSHTFGGSPMRVVTLDTRAREETLSLEIDEYSKDGDINLFFNYNPQLISAAEAEQLAQAFEMALADVATDGDRLVREIRLSPPDATVRLPHHAPEHTILDQVERRAAENPGAEAVISGGDRITRGQLRQDSNRIADFLHISAAAAPEDPVAVLCDRDTEWITAMLGVLKAGCAYLPLDPEMPRERLQFALHDSGCRLLLCGGPYRTESFPGVRSIPVTDAVVEAERPWALPALSAHSLAYIMYTSGVSGQPKGVLIEHRSLANTIAELRLGWEVSERDRVLEFASPMFDASLVDIFLGLASGAPLVIAARETILNPRQFLDLLVRERVTVATLPPAYLSALGAVDLTPLRLLITAGEAANPAALAQHLRRVTYVNAYGPTEAAVCASYYKVVAGTEFCAPRVPIGKAIGNTRISIMDEELRPQPVGVVGELCVSGAGLARGYLRRPELTTAHFVMNPHRAGERIYRTGDLGRLLPDGNIEFVGRRDTQVKIRGYRVEPGEIEAALATHPAVETAIVTSGIFGGHTELVAYVVPRADWEPRQLRQFLASRLPAFMVPSRWMRIATAPLSPSGKVDREALPDPGTAEAIRPGAGSAPPGTPTEQALAAIWKDVLDVAEVGVESDFFESGGHSLKAIRVLSRIQAGFHVQIELADLFSHPTLAGLAAWVDQHAPAVENAIPRAPSLQSYPLSNAQARIWVHAQMDGGLVAYNMPLALAIEGSLNESRLQEAFRAVIRRHESLRTCFISSRGVPRQKILPDGDWAFELDRVDLTGAASPEAAGLLHIQEEFARPFDLSRAPLLRARVFRVAAERWLLSLVVHHIVADGWSLSVLLRDLQASYARAADLPAVPIQYRDYSQWMAGRLEHLRQERAFWEKTLAPPLPVLHLPADYPRPAALGFAGASARFPLSLASSVDLAGFCGARRISPFMVLLAAVFGLLRRYSGDEDLIVGVPVANRGRAELEEQIGLYVNTLAVRVRINPDFTLSDLLEAVRTALLKAQEHQSYPFDALVQDLALERSTDRNPLFAVMTVMQDEALPEFRAPGIQAYEYPVPVDVSVFDLTFHFSPGDSGMRLDLEYNTALFSRPRIESLAGHLDRLIEAIVSAPATKLDDADILKTEERRVLDGFSRGVTAHPSPGTVIDWFAAQACRTPCHPAVIYEERSLTYAELAKAAGELAHRIRRAGTAPGAVTALLANRSEWMVAGVIGIMASGAACLPLDAAWPQARIAHLLEDSGCAAVVADCAVPAGPWHVISLRAIDPVESPLVSCARSAGIAYIAYTSGSTGTPKGALIAHHALANLINALGNCLYECLPHPARELLITSMAFDVAIKQVFGALTRGHTLVIASDALRHDPAELMDAVTQGAVHLLDLTPSHFAVLLAQGFAQISKGSLQAIVLGSEPLPCALVEEFWKTADNRRIELFNFYGPSECTVETLACRLNHISLQTARIAPIGRPLANTRAYVLSSGLQPVPIGIPGEICLGGAAVGVGYQNRAELTAEKFVHDPYVPGARMYRTGDLGRWRADGQLEFLGRTDGQLKVRGYRIEPGEVEHHLLRHPHVTRAAVGARSSPAGHPELVAWYVAAEPVPDPDSVRSHLRHYLPDYMVPARLMAVLDIPLRVNGKVDHEALPDPWAESSGPAAEPLRDYGLEAKIRAMWQQVLGVEPGLDVSFFHIGGNSLRLVALHSLIAEQYPGTIRLVEMFSASTVREQAQLIRQQAAAVVADNTGPLHLLTAGGSAARNVFCFSPVAGYSHSYSRLARQLSTWNVYGVEFLETIRPASVLAGLLMDVQTEGSFVLLGYSSGGNLAYDTALELYARGRDVAGLVFLDAWRRPEAVYSTDEEYSRNAEELLAALGASDYPPDQRHAIRSRIHAYDRYLNSRAENRKVSCPIRLVRAEAQDFACSFHITQEGWAELTDDFTVISGSGRHLRMLDATHILRNAAIVENLLEDMVACPASK